MRSAYQALVAVLDAIHRSALIVLVAVPLLSGCAGVSSFHLSPPPTERSRSQMRSVQLIDGPSDTRIVFSGPADGALEGAWRGARAGFLTTLAVGASVGSGGQYAALAGLGVMALAPVGALLGASIGAGKAEPAAKVKETETVIREVLLEWNVRERFRECVGSALRERAPHIVLAASESEPAEAILEITVEGAGLSGDTRLINPPLSVVLTERTRILRAANGPELYTHTLNWRGQLRPLDEWVAHNGALVKTDVERACRDVAEALVDEIFLLYLPAGGR